MTLAEIVAQKKAALSVADVASLLQISQRLVYQMAADGKIPSFRLGGTIRFDPQILSDWLRQKTTPPHPTRTLADYRAAQRHVVGLFRQPPPAWLDMPVDPARSRLRALQTNKPGQALSARDVAEIMGADEAAINGLALWKELPGFEIAGEMRFDPESVRGWLG